MQQRVNASHQQARDRASAGEDAPRRFTSLAGWIMLAVMVVASATMWDVELEYEAALEEFADDQIALAGMVAEAFTAHLAAQDQARTSPGQPPAAFLNAVHAFERPHERIIYVAPPDFSELRGTDGRLVQSAVVLAAAKRGEDIVQLSRSEAQDLALAPRKGIAAIARTRLKAPDQWTAVVVSSESHARDRGTRARWRLLLGAFVPGSLIVAIGMSALRRQRRELELTRELALTEAQRQGDERLARANRAAITGTLAMGIAHEISTPLGTIVGRAEQLLVRLADDEKGARAAQVIADSAQHISQVIRGLLDLAHGGAPEVQIEQPERVLRHAASLVEHRMTRAGVALELSVASVIPEIRIHIQLIEQAIVNLLLNACDASQAGGVVRASIAVDAPGFVDFVVADWGVGISHADAARAFDPFFTTKPAGTGTGIGLAVTNEIVKSHRGILTLKPASGGGTEARIRLPVHVRDAGPQSGAEA